ncbi:MAG: hypothetical protein P4L50_17725 [Anaerolineaceae bacterium]|nr:hypothetical protein [Anaerolineaceae bacterium]
MGGSGWSYFVPFQTDINQAFQELKESTFQNGEYFTELEFLKGFVEFMQEQLSPESISQTQERIAQLQNQPSPSSIEELLQMNAENGTHSIIDMEGISETPDFGRITPFSPQDLIDLFGTEKPTREMAEEKLDEIGRRCKKWQGIYFTVFQNNLPSEILFIGVSGD